MNQSALLRLWATTGTFSTGVIDRLGHRLTQVQVLDEFHLGVDAG